MFIIFIILIITLTFIICYGIQKETEKKIKYIDKYYFTLKYVVKNFPKEKYDELLNELKKEFGGY